MPEELLFVSFDLEVLCDKTTLPFIKDLFDPTISTGLPIRKLTRVENLATLPRAVAAKASTS